MVLEAGSLTRGCPHGQDLLGADFLVHEQMSSLIMEGARELPQASLIRTLISFMWALPL